MSEKRITLKKLHAEIEVKDKVIGALLKEINANNVPVPTHIVKILKALYSGKLKNQKEIDNAKLQ